ncbi:MAG TPA: sulfotransferase [Pseudomonadales bacterium]|nr:sulfotransferase [Pseudomonadales bacterium]
MLHPRVVFVLSCNYSGSHLLARLLGAHPACADIGELRNLPKFRARPGPNASGTEARYAVDPLFAGIESLPATRWHGWLLERIRAVDPAVCVLVDNSKRLDWVARFVGRDDLDARCVHLLRDPRALARRWQGIFTTPAARRRARLRELRRQWRRAPRMLRAPMTEIHGWRWLRENRAISTFLARHQPAAPVVTYEALVADPAACLAQLMPSLGLAYDARQLDADAAAPFGTHKPAWAGAGPASALQADLRWQQELDAAAAQAVIAPAALRDYAAALGYGFGPAGLQAQTTSHEETDR